MNKEDINHPSVLNFINSDKFIQQEFVFLKGLGDSKDHKLCIPDKDMMGCFLWEMGRTYLYENPEDLVFLKARNEDSTFPHSVSTWPSKPYLSHRIERRSRWNVKVPDTKFKHKSLFHNALAIPREEQGIEHRYQNRELKYIDLPETTFRHQNLDSSLERVSTDNLDGGANTFSENPNESLSDILFQSEESSTISASVPILLHMGVNWNKSNFKEAIDSQWSEIEELRKSLIKAYESKGARFNQPKPLRVDEFLSQALRQLGHYRLLCHCELEWNEVQKWMKPFNYSTKDKFIKSIRSAGNQGLFPMLGLSSNGNELSSILARLYEG